MTDHIEILEQIESSVSFYEADKPEFVETLQHAIQVLKRLEDREGIEKVIIEHCKDFTFNGSKLITALQDYLKEA